MGSNEWAGTMRRVYKEAVAPYWRTYVIILAPLLPIGLLVHHYDDPVSSFHHL
jgi:hypothetical protein